LHTCVGLSNSISMQQLTLHGANSALSASHQQLAARQRQHSIPQHVPSCCAYRQLHQQPSLPAAVQPAVHLSRSSWSRLQAAAVLAEAPAAAPSKVGTRLGAAYSEDSNMPDWHKGRRAGVILHPTSLPGPHGIGELGGEAFKFIDWLAGAGMQCWQVRGAGDWPMCN
jgi:4-alpha-glucanotransferase